MQAEEVQEDLCVLQERLAQCSAEAQRHKKLLGFVEKKQQYLREIVEQLSMEVSVPYFARVPLLWCWGCVRASVPVSGTSSQNCEVVRCFQTNCRGLQQLEGHMARMKRRQWSELAGAVLEQAEVKKLLRNRLKLLRQKCEGFQEPAASWTRRNKTISWLQRLCVFLLLLQIVTFVVLLTSDGLNWVLPPKLGAALGSCPARAWFF
ncbi:uncharacterized protein LOC134167755 isoform X2 [Pezoporus occidentalis]|uniref:uncharacterized protein LOC134167755 isoform X2 n=1 Tax=Pezoporus occidentalis TaxID=407982 RepID=UPI002F90DA29